MPDQEFDGLDSQTSRVQDITVFFPRDVYLSIRAPVQAVNQSAVRTSPM
jgi:hypothetical protein